MAVRRPLLPQDRLELRDNNIPRVNRECGDVSIKWHRYGDIACTLIEKGEYQMARDKSQARGLKQLGVNEVRNRLQAALKEEPMRSQSEGGRLAAPVTAVDFLGLGRFLRIAYILDSPELVAENARFRDFIDEQNGINGHWKPFEPSISLATIPDYNATQDVLDAFLRIAPEEVTLEPPLPMIG
jgi:hypothetical protein